MSWIDRKSKVKLHAWDQENKVRKNKDSKSTSVIAVSSEVGIFCSFHKSHIKHNEVEMRHNCHSLIPSIIFIWISHHNFWLVNDHLTNKFSFLLVRDFIMKKLPQEQLITQDSLKNFYQRITSKRKQFSKLCNISTVTKTHGSQTIHRVI